MCGDWRGSFDCDGLTEKCFSEGNLELLKGPAALQPFGHVEREVIPVLKSPVQDGLAILRLEILVESTKSLDIPGERKHRKEPVLENTSSEQNRCLCPFTSGD